MQDTWTIERASTLAGGSAGLRSASEARQTLSAYWPDQRSARELDPLVLSRLLSHDVVQVDQPLPLEDLLTGLTDAELPGHTEQLLAQLPESAKVEAAR